MAACSGCGTENPPPAKYCRQCGVSLSEPGIRSRTQSTPLLARWRRLSHQVTRKELRDLLGEPLRRDTTETEDGERVEVWMYEYQSTTQPGEKISGTVVISVSELRVIGWQEPDWERLN